MSTAGPDDPTAHGPTVAAPTAACRTPAQVGPYRVVRELGRGGMGVVYEVRHPDHPDRGLALKRILGDPGAEALARFEREAEALARVRHRGVVVVHQLGRLPEGPYLVTELVVGSSLSGLPRQGPVPPRRAAEVVRDLADAVAAVHAQGVLHRDLKPDNVLLRAEDGSPVLLDFGVARDATAQRLTATGTIVGTPAYLSPEQAAGGDPAALDARADVYGLGAILFFLLADRAPHAAASPILSIKRALLEEPAWPSRDRADVPAELEAILRRAMAREPDGRHPSAAALRDDLARWLAGGRVAAARPRRRGLLAAGVGGALLLLAAAPLLRPDDRPPSDEPAPRASPVATATAPAPTPPGDAPPPGSWQARLRSPTPPPWGGAPHLVLRAATRGDLSAQAVFLDDDHVATLAGSTLKVWTLDGRAQLQTSPDAALELPASAHMKAPPGFLESRVLARGPRGRALVLSVFSATLWVVALDGGRPAPTSRQLEGAEPLGFRLAALGDDVLVARAGPDRGRALRSTVCRVDPAGREHPLFELPGAVTDLAAQGDLVAAASNPQAADLGAVVVHDLTAGRDLVRLETLDRDVRAVAIHPSGGWVALGEDAGLLQRLEVPAGTLLELLTPGLVGRTARPSAHRNHVTALAFDPAGRLWSAGGARGEGELRGWSPAGPLEAFVREGGPGLASVDVAPSGRAVVVGTRDGEAEVWLLPPP